MLIQQEWSKIKVRVINLKQRKEKKKYIKQQLERRNIQHQFFQAELHPTSPKRGCLESHLQVIKEAIADKQRRYNKLMIFEDDAKFIGSFASLKNLPEQWDMCYFGGTVFRVLDDGHGESSGWSRVQTWTTHAYMINLENEEFIQKILEMEHYEGEIDRFYLEQIHPDYHCYMANPMIIIQKEGYSDIEGKMVDYSFMTQTLRGLRVPESGTDEQGNFLLKLPDIPFSQLPPVSIITPTYNRRTLFGMAMYNVFGFVYPADKIEWIIVEDKTTNMTEEDTLVGLLPDHDPRIKHILLDSGDDPFTIAMKRNIGVSHASHNIIVHVDDDDIYEEYSLLSRVKLLLKYQSSGILCIGSTMIGTYDIIQNKSSMASDGPISLSEASMAYFKSFWSQKHFDDNCIRGEHKSFTEGRLHQIMDVPYCCTVIALIHKKNFTHQIRDQIEQNTSTTDKGTLKYKNTGEVANFLDTFPEERQLFLLQLRDMLMLE
jgi:hypothetical protein